MVVVIAGGISPRLWKELLLAVRTYAGYRQTKTEILAQLSDQINGNLHDLKIAFSVFYSILTSH